MKRISSMIIGLGLLTSFALVAQQPAAKVDSSLTALDHKIEVYQKENIPYKSPIPYSFVREQDVFKEWIVYRWVDLREKANLSLFYPTENIGSRINLINVLMKGVDNGEITPYDPSDLKNEFARAMSIEELDERLGAGVRAIADYNEYGERLEDKMIQMSRQLNDVKLLLVKEKIYFDKRRSALNRVVIGICPIREYAKDLGGDEGGEGNVEKKLVMWVYMPEARDILARHPIYNRFNDAQNISFDDFFMQNMYRGRIYGTANVYNNRTIGEYAGTTEDALYESQRIEMEIFNFEQDLWEY